uniref:CMRF35-like molecule 8 isoform X2 n=1 Tax=Scatophagus argus TaxID=75038 RepID=UPI001ED7F57A|nr:CMRF35-like molecule 8 isoform X2 [Scatophagus argus]
MITQAILTPTSHHQSLRSSHTISATQVLASTGIRGKQSKIHLSAQEGGLVSISCPYDPGYEGYPKYFSKGDYGKRSTIIRTTDGKPKNTIRKGKFYLCDDTKKRILNVTIHNLNLNDAGTYWCEIDTYGFDPKIQIELRVHKAPAPLKPPMATSSPPISNTVQVLMRNQQHSARATVSASFLTGTKGGPGSITCVNPPVNKTVKNGDSVAISCLYATAGEGMMKHFCKEKENFNCTSLVSTYTANYTIRERFTLTDNVQQRYFNVTISTLSHTDAGRYRCAMEGYNNNNNSIPCLTEIHLSVFTESNTTPKTSVRLPSSDQGTAFPEDDNPPNTGMIGGVSGCLALLVILLAVLLLVKDKLLKTQMCCAARGSSEQRTNIGHNTEGNHGDHNYEDIEMQEPQASPGDALLSVYSTASLPKDELHYVSVSFQKNSVSVSTEDNQPPDTVKNGSCDYSSISSPQVATHPPVTVQTVYSTVSKHREETGNVSPDHVKCEG